MKQKLKEKISVGDKVKKPSLQKCLKMSKENENLKNGVLNGDSVITKNHTQQQQQLKLNNNSNVDRDPTAKIVGGRLQFYKDGKFILELARAREGEKTGWISVPRKTYWPPTISTNSSTTFIKHESSTSLSYSDDNSSIQSSPWQRDHSWKQARPRHNVSKEMAFFYSRPTRLHLSQTSQKIAQSMRRRPLNKNETISFDEKEKERRSQEEEKEIKVEKVVNQDSSEGEEKETSSSNSDSKESIDSIDGNSKKLDKPRIEKRKLNNIVKELSDRMASKLALNGNHSNGHQHVSTTAVIPTSYSLASHIVSSINSQSPHQHVSPRKRILRELEKVSLEDSKRSRPKSITSNGNGISAPSSQQSLIVGNGSAKIADKAPPTVSRPISSYSITSLLAHNTSSSSSNGSSSSSALVHNSISTTHPDSLSASHNSYQHQHSPPSKSPSSSQMHHHQGNYKRKSPTNTSPSETAGHMRSPIQSPSPEHHAFHKYRPIATTPTSSSSVSAPTASSSSPYSSSFNSPNYMRGSPSPCSSDVLNSRLRTNAGNFQHSPSHFRTNSPSSYGSNVQRDSSLSPNVVERSSANSQSNASAGMRRTVPKKTAALRQQFASPDENNKVKSSPSSGNSAVKNDVKPMDVDPLIRQQQALIGPPPIPSALTHPAAMAHYPYMYSPVSYIAQPAIPPYYHPFYNPAMMAMAAASYRFPIPGYPHPASAPPPTSTITSNVAISSAPSASYADDKGTPYIKHESHLSAPPSPTHHPAYIAASPWNPIPLNNHSINDGNLIPKVKIESSSDLPLNLSKH